MIGNAGRRRPMLQCILAIAGCLLLGFCVHDDTSSLESHYLAVAQRLMAGIPMATALHYATPTNADSRDLNFAHESFVALGDMVETR